MKLKNIAKLIRWDLGTNRKGYINTAIGYIAGIVLLGLCTHQVNSGQSSPGDLYFVAYLISCIGILTSISKELHSKTRRISMLMLPASMNEKLLSRVLIYAVLWPIVLLLCTFVGDGIQYVMNSLIFSQKVAVLGSEDFLHNIGYPKIQVYGVDAPGTYGLWQIWLSFNLFLLLFSYLFACGCVWTKRAALKGMAVFVAFSFIFGTVLMGIVNHLNWTPLIQWLEANDGDTIGHVFGSLLSLFMLGTSFFLLWFGHRCFVNRQIVDKKWRDYGF